MAKIIWQYKEQSGSAMQRVQGELVDCEDLFNLFKTIERIAYAELSHNGNNIDVFDR